MMSFYINDTASNISKLQYIFIKHSFLIKTYYCSSISKSNTICWHNYIKGLLDTVYIGRIFPLPLALLHYTSRLLFLVVCCSITVCPSVWNSSAPQSNNAVSTFQITCRVLSYVLKNSSSITKGSISTNIKHMHIQPFSIGVNWRENWHQMNVSTMSYICRYYVFTLWESCRVASEYLHR